MKPLSEYTKKRNFRKTPEPSGKKNHAGNAGLRFVVHKHDARATHWDLRLEVGGVLASWAVPKGPSLDPTQKHLAVHVEDHPFDYRNFEGVIPKGNYGAGTAMIWDEGVYASRQVTNYPSTTLRTFGKLQMTNNIEEKNIQEGIKKGHLTFLLSGKKLKGEFALVRLKKGGKNDWLLIKANDKYAQPGFIPDNISARSGKNMHQIRNSNLKLPKTNHGRREPLPRNIKPMMATLVADPFDSPEWIFEIKWDGFRAITQIENGEVQIYSRNGKSFLARFPQIAETFQGFPKNAVFDGEIVALDAEGRSSFGLMSDHTGSAKIEYFIFDILYYDGRSLFSEPLEKRRGLLKKVIEQLEGDVHFSEDIQEKGIAFFEAAEGKYLEGIIAKKKGSVYEVGKRSRDWLKIKVHQSQEAIICGYTKPQGARKGFGALILGVYESGKLIHIGNVGTGFNGRLIKELLKTMKPYVIAKSPFDSDVKIKDATWIKPVLVCEVKFQEWTKENSLRQPVFLGLRTDKASKEVHREVPR